MRGRCVCRARVRVTLCAHVHALAKLTDALGGALCPIQPRRRSRAIVRVVAHDVALARSAPAANVPQKTPTEPGYPDSVGARPATAQFAGMSKFLFSTTAGAPVNAGTLARRNTMTTQSPVVVLANDGVRIDTAPTLPFGS
jgi:hypothetical protein